MVDGEAGVAPRFAGATIPAMSSSAARDARLPSVSRNDFVEYMQQVVWALSRDGVQAARKAQ